MSLLTHDIHNMYLPQLDLHQGYLSRNCLNQPIVEGHFSTVNISKILYKMPHEKCILYMYRHTNYKENLSKGKAFSQNMHNFKYIIPVIPYSHKNFLK